MKLDIYLCLLSYNNFIFNNQINIDFCHIETTTKSTIFNFCYFKYDNIAPLFNNVDILYIYNCSIDIFSSLGTQPIRIGNSTYGPIFNKFYQTYLCKQLYDLDTTYSPTPYIYQVELLNPITFINENNPFTSLITSIFSFIFFLIQ